MDPTKEGGLRRRGRALEEGFFAKVEREQIEHRRDEQERGDARRRLVRESGLDDESVELLLDVGIQAEVLPGLDPARRGRLVGRRSERGGEGGAAGRCGGGPNRFRPSSPPPAAELDRAAPRVRSVRCVGASRISRRKVA